MKRTLSFLLSLVMISGIILNAPVTVNAASSGICGDNLTWTLDDEGTLTISGVGEMYDYSSDTSAPWYSIRSDIDTVVVNDGATSVGDYAFYACGNLFSVTIPDSVTIIGDSAFQFCSYLMALTVGDGITSIGDYAFSNCSGLQAIRIPDSVTGIGDYAFVGCSTLSSVMLSDSLISIGSYAFAHCTGLEFITIPDGVTSIGDSAFESCRSLEEIVIPDNVTGIGGSAFEECTSLKTVTIGKSVTTIEPRAFYSCTRLEAIVIPESITSICDSVFFNCTNLKYAFYTGTKEEWLAISIGPLNPGLTNVKIHYETTEHICSDWITDKKATVYKAGSKYKECTECGVKLETAELPQLKCATPKLKTVANVANGIKLTWNKVSGADNYVIYRKTGKNAWKKIAAVKGTVTNYTDKTAKSGKTYKYTVRAKNEAGLSGYNTKGLTIKCIADPVLKTPTNSKSGITLKWSKVTGAQGYVIYRKAGDGSFKKLTTVKGSTKVSCTDKSVKKGKKYTYKLKAYSGKTYSAYSNSKSIKDKY